MEQSGRVIIFKDEEEAKIWFESITEYNKHSKLQQSIKNFEEFQERHKH